MTHMTLCPVLFYVGLRPVNSHGRCVLLAVQVPEEDSQPSTEVDLFVSAEKIMVLDTGHRVSRFVLS